MSGTVYVITNAAFGGWCKVGLASNMAKRFKDYYTYAPIPYELAYEREVVDASMVENLAHKILEDYGRSSNGGTEWFQCSVDDAIDAIDKAVKRFEVIQQYIEGKEEPLSDMPNSGVLERIEAALTKITEMNST